MLSIAFVDCLGLAFDGTTINKTGLGGSESAMISIARELAKLDFKVYIFNDCSSDDKSPGVYDGVHYEPLPNIVHHQFFDIIVASRSVAAFMDNPQNFKQTFPNLPDFSHVIDNSGYKVLWMHDTFCDGDDFIEPLVLSGRINKIFTLSDWHTTYVTNCDHGRKRNFETLKDFIWQTRNGINSWIDWVDVKEKDPNLFVYNSSYTKGMEPLVRNIWPRVKERIPEAKLKVIGGFYRFRETDGPDKQENDTVKLREEFDGKLGIEFTGVIPQKEIAEILAKASFMAYPAQFPETFGISTLESLYYNTPLVTCNFGALEETAVNLACYKMPYAIWPHVYSPQLDPEVQENFFVDLLEHAYNEPYILQQKQNFCNIVKDVATWDTVALQWKQHFYKILQKYLPLDEYKKVTEINNKVARVFGRRYINEDEYTIAKRSKEQKITVITCCYNAEEYVERCIESIKSQNYENYEVVIIDDNSSDNTLRIISENVTDKFKVIANKTNKGAVRNQVEALRTINSNDIIMIIDGDDALDNNPGIFDFYNNFYFDNDAEFTYGSCWSEADQIPLVAQPYPPSIKEAKEYRNYRFNWNVPYTHLRTFRKNLIDSVPDSSFQFEGEWIKAGGDVAVFYELIEKADPTKVHAISEIVYIYNDINPLNDYKVNSDEQNETAKKIIERRMDRIEEEFLAAKNTPSDINEHLDVLHTYASKSDSVTEFGVREGASTRAFLKAGKKLRSYDLYISNTVDELFTEARSNGMDCQYQQADTLNLEIEPCDLLFIDTDHTYPQLAQELKLHHNKVNKYIAFHDTHTYGVKSEEGDPGLLPAILEFLRDHPEWQVDYHTHNNNGLTILRKGSEECFTVAVPTMWKVNDLFKRALISYINNPLVKQITIINNNKEDTPSWDLLDHPKINMLVQPENIFVNPAWNLGVETSPTNLVCVVNDDIIFDPFLLNRVREEFTENVGTIGLIAGEPTFNQPVTTDYSISFKDFVSGDNPHGFGQCYFVKKDQWNHIPDQLLVYFGDNYIFDTYLKEGKINKFAYNTYFESDFAQTVSTMPDTLERLERERILYNEILAKEITEVDLPTKTVLIAFPENQYINPETLKSIYNLEVPKNIKTRLEFFYGYQRHQVRNLTCDQWASSFDYVLFVNNNIIYPKDTLINLLDLYVDIATGWVDDGFDSTTYIMQENELNPIKSADIKNFSGYSLSVDACDSSCLLVSNNAFLNLDFPYFSGDTKFDSDLTFSLNARDVGIPTYCSPSTRCVIA